MRVGLMQFAPQRGDVGANLDRIGRALAGVRADLIVLPELCTSGYLFASRADIARLAEPVPGGSTCATMAVFSRERETAIVWGMAESAGGSIYNSAIMVTPHGEFHVYRKAHLFADEKDIFDPGDSPFPVVDLCLPSRSGRGNGEVTKVGMLVCFDHFFPEAARSLALHGAQIVCHPSNLVMEYAHTNTVTRAVENRVFWILANRTGSETLDEKTLAFNGASQIVAPDGKLLARAGPDTEEVVIVDIDPARALDKMVTPRNDLFHDRRTDLYSV
ncbi:MAG TPA: nitrilase-related carbon-nitrogen hydrolase [bacterium]|nr:nitrilase-related carbon-nitrogen hydrolase [bacterium]